MKGILKVGRPPMYETKEEIIAVMDEYFDSVSWEIDGKKFYKPTMSGLAFALGMSRQALLKYKEKEEFIVTIKRARQIVEIALEEGLYGTAVTGLIFNLKNNFEWTDKTEVAQEVKTTGYVVQTEPLDMKLWQEMGKESQSQINEALEKLTGGKK